MRRHRARAKVILGYAPDSSGHLPRVARTLRDLKVCLPWLRIGYRGRLKLGKLGRLVKY